MSCQILTRQTLLNLFPCIYMHLNYEVPTLKNQVFCLGDDFNNTHPSTPSKMTDIEITGLNSIEKPKDTEVPSQCPGETFFSTGLNPIFLLWPM